MKNARKLLLTAIIALFCGLTSVQGLAQALEVIELVWRSREARDGLIGRLLQEGVEVRYYTPDYEQESDAPEEYTMMRVVNARRLVEKLQLPDCSFTMEVRDDFLPWNNASFLCTSRDGNTQTAHYGGPSADIVADVRDLARMAAGKQNKAAVADNEIFSKQNTVFFNTY